MSVKSVEATELRDLDRDELWTQLDNARRELVSLRFQQATGQIDDHSKLGRARRRVARIMTIIREAELEEDGLLDHRSVQVRWYEPVGGAEGGKTSISKSADVNAVADEGEGADDSADAGTVDNESVDEGVGESAESADDSADAGTVDDESVDEGVVESAESADDGAVADDKTVNAGDSAGEDATDETATNEDSAGTDETAGDSADETADAGDSMAAGVESVDGEEGVQS